MPCFGASRHGRIYRAAKTVDLLMICGTLIPSDVSITFARSDSNYTRSSIPASNLLRIR